MIAWKPARQLGVPFTVTCEIVFAATLRQAPYVMSDEPPDAPATKVNPPATTTAAINAIVNFVNFMPPLTRSVRPVGEITEGDRMKSRALAEKNLIHENGDQSALFRVP